jgi:hypothetical protein
MPPAPVALDLQALQDGSGATAARAAQVAALAARLARRGRLAAGLLTPELPAPPFAALPAELAGAQAARLRWDTRAEARHLLNNHAGLVHLIPAPLLNTGPGGPTGLIVSPHWAELGVTRAVMIDRTDVEAFAAGPGRERLTARLEWIRGADLVVVDGDAPTADLGLPPARTVTGEGWMERVDGLHPHPGAATGGGPEHRYRPPRLALYGPLPPYGGGIGAYNARFLEAAAAGGASIDAVISRGRPGPGQVPKGAGVVHAEAFGVDVRPASYDAVVYTLGNSDGHLPTVEAALRHPGWLWLHEARLPAIATTALDGADDGEFEAHLQRLLERAYPGRPPGPAARAAGRSDLALARAGVGLTAPLVGRAAGVLVNSNAARESLLLDQPPLAAVPPVVVLPPACPPVRSPRRPPPAAAPPLAVALGVVAMGKRPDLLVDAAAQAGCRLAFVGPCPAILEQVIRDRAATRGVADHVEVVGEVDQASWWAWMDRATVAVQTRDSSGGEMSAAVLDALSAGVPTLTNLASARDYPTGTVDLVDDPAPDASGLAEHLAALLADAERCQGLSVAAQRFAADNQMADVATAVFEAVGTPTG